MELVPTDDPPGSDNDSDTEARPDPEAQAREYIARVLEAPLAPHPAPPDVGSKVWAPALPPPELKKSPGGAEAVEGGLLGLPLELILEICSYLEPRFVLEVLPRVCRVLLGVVRDTVTWRIRVQKRVCASYPVVEGRAQTLGFCPCPHCCWLFETAELVPYPLFQSSSLVSG